MTLQQLLAAIDELSLDDKRVVAEHLREVLTPIRHSLSEYRGMAEQLRDQDAQEYVNELRREWDHRP